jgi:hypothetical protein
MEVLNRQPNSGHGSAMATSPDQLSNDETLSICFCV